MLGGDIKKTQPHIQEMIVAHCCHLQDPTTFFGKYAGLERLIQSQYQALMAEPA